MEIISSPPINEKTITEGHQDELSRLARIELARVFAKEGDVLSWGKCLFPEKFQLPFCSELHQYLVDTRTEPFLNIEAPRYHSKTTVCCFLIQIYTALNEPERYRHYLNVQATGTKALAINVAIKSEIETNRELHAIYGDVQSGRWTDQQFVLTVRRQMVIFTGVGAGQSIRGINYRNIRPDFIQVDDLYDEEDINNPDSTEKKNEWFWSSLYPARARSRDCAIHLNGTAINDQDLLERLKKQPRWKSKTFRAIKNWETKEVLWPELNTFESLEQDRSDMGSVIFFREMQNERRQDATAVIKRSWIKYYDPAALKFDNHFRCVGVILGVDPSIGEDHQDDATGIVLALECQYEDAKTTVFHVEQIWNERITLDQRIQLLMKIMTGRPKERPITRAPIEGIAGFKDFVAEVKRRTALPVREISFVKDKISTLESKSHYFENSRVLINKFIDPSLLDAFVYQLTTNYPKHDDMRDAMLLCLDHSTAGWRFV